MNSRLLTLGILTLLSSAVFAQNGTIRGVLRDAYTQQPVKEGYVQIQERGIRVFTDENGYYTLSNLPVQLYRVDFSAPGYRTRSVPNLSVKPSQITNVNIVLEPIYIQKGQLGRYASLETESIAESQAAQSIVSGLNKGQLQKAAEQETSYLLRQIPGLAISDARFLTIRGLNPRYNNFQFSTTFLSTTESDTKSFPLDLLPAQALEKITVFKSPSAELPSDFAGGVVQFSPETMPVQNSLQVELTAGYRQGSTFSAFRKADNGPHYSLGFNNQYQDIPTNFPKNLNSLGGNTQALANVGTLLKNNWVANASTAQPNQRLVLSGGLKLLDTPRLKIGSFSAFSYQNQYSKFQIERGDYNQNQGGTESPIFQFNDTQYNQTIRLGILHNWAFQFNKARINFNHLLSQSSIGRYVARTGQHIEFNYLPNDHAFNQIYATHYLGQLEGNHPLNDENTASVDWSVSYTYSHRNQPDFRRYRSDFEPSTATSTLYVPTGRAFSFFLGRFSSLQTDNSIAANLALKKQILLNQQEGRKGQWSVGVFAERKTRSFAARNLGYIRSATSTFSTELLAGSIDELFAPANQNPVTGIRMDELTNASDSYKGDLQLLGGFAKLSLPLTTKLSVIGGLRTEKSLQQLTSNEVSNEAIVRTLDNLNILPSVNVTYNLSTTTLLRLAYGQTINRPEFRELAPFNFFDWDYNYIVRGNELKQAQIHNFDVRWERYPSPNEVISIAAFFKYFQNPIETVVEAGGGGTGGSKTFTFTNARNATNAGIEVEIRKSLAPNHSSALLKNLHLVFSGSIIASNVSLGEKALGQSTARPLQGQAPFLINMGFNYTNSTRDFSANLFYNVMGKRIFAVGFEGYPDWYEMPRNVVDIHLTKQFNQRFLVRLSIDDLLNQSAVILQDGNQNGRYERSRDQIIQRYSPGQLIQIGVGYKW